MLGRNMFRLCYGCRKPPNISIHCCLIGLYRGKGAVGMDLIHSWILGLAWIEGMARLMAQKESGIKESLTPLHLVTRDPLRQRWCPLYAFARSWDLQTVSQLECHCSTQSGNLGPGGYHKAEVFHCWIKVTQFCRISSSSPLRILSRGMKIPQQLFCKKLPWKTRFL